MLGLVEILKENTKQVNMKLFLPSNSLQSYRVLCF